MNLLLKFDKKGIHGIYLSSNLIQLIILLFADDIVLMSDPVVDLQHQLNVFVSIYQTPGPGGKYQVVANIKHFLRKFTVMVDGFFGISNVITK